MSTASIEREIEKTQEQLERLTQRLEAEKKSESIEVGDIVRVERKCEDHDGGWVNAWIPDMGEAVGEEYTVKTTRDLGVYFKEIPSGFPAHCLSVVTRAEDVLPKGLSFQQAVEYLAGSPRREELMADAGEFLYRFVVSYAGVLKDPSGEGDYTTADDDFTKKFDIVKR